MMVDLEWLLGEIERQALFNQEEANKISLSGEFTKAAYYFGCEGSLRELRRNLVIKFRE